MSQGRSLFKSCFRNEMFALVPYEVWRDLVVAQLDLRTLCNFVQLSKGCKKISQELCRGFLGLVRCYIDDEVSVANENLLKARLCLFNDAKIKYEYAYTIEVFQRVLWTPCDDDDFLQVSNQEEQIVEFSQRAKQRFQINNKKE